MSATLITADVEKPEIDSRTYRIVRLDNELEALLVHDAETDKASAALDVHVGHLSDPWDAAGLAHFCEHLLFMGTEKYPRENDYSEYLSAHNGSSNAYTGTVDTNYFFDVGHEYLEPALDRFSQFFLKPLFLESCKDRELLAVDSENKKNLQNDMWRAYQLEKSLSNPEHVYSKFGTGNIETLKDIPASLGHDVRDELLKFHSDLYSANQMKLVLLGREPLDELEELVTTKFSGILNKKRRAPHFPGDILRPGHELGTIYSFVPIKEVRNLELCFPIPECDSLWRSQPAHYLSHLIGHEGQGSILSYLKARGWVLYLGAGGSDASPGTDFFKINMELTLAGAENWERIVEAIFAYINIVKKDGIQRWIFDELKLISEAQFRFKERQPASRFTSGTAGKLQSSIEKRFILGTSVPREFRADEIQSVLDALNCQNFRVAFADPAVKDALLEEKYYGTRYRVDKLSETLLQRCSPSSSVDIPELHLPLKNEFVPEHFDTSRKEVSKPLTKAILIKHTPFMKVWHKKDDTFWVPKANYLFLMRNPAYRVSAKTAVMTKLFLELLKDNLNEYAYNADIAGLQYAMDPTVGAFTLTFSGYNDKMDVLIEKVVTRMKHLDIESDRFDIEKDRLLRDLNNFDYEAPYTQVGYHMSFLQAHTAWSKEQQAAALLEVKLKFMQEFAASMFDKFHIEVLAHGNLREEEVLATTENVQNILMQNNRQAGAAKTIILLKTKSTPKDPYETAFLEKGYRPYFVPVLEHSMVNLDTLCTSCSTASRRYSGMIVTSQRSVEAIGQILPKLEERVTADLLRIPIYTVGPATHKAIENLGFTNILGSESGNGDALASYILDRREAEDSRPLFFVVGDKRRDIISKRMAKASAALEELIVYETGTVSSFESDFSAAVQEAGSVEWLVFFSPAGADVALQHIVSTGNKTRIATIGPTTEDYLVSQWSTRPDVVSPKPDADSLAKSLVDALKASSPLHPDETGSMRALWMPKGSSFVEHPLKDPSNINSCIEYFVQVGSTSDMTQLATTRLFAQICAEPAFNQLRTKEQLGYVVASGSKVALTSNGFRILIQSERDATYLASRIDSFLDLLKTLLIDMSVDEFRKHKTSLIDKLNEKPKNLAQETKRYWSHITSGLYNFDELEQQTSILQTIDKAQVIEFFDTYVHRSSPQRRHVSMIMKAHNSTADMTVEASHTVRVVDVDQFKAGCQVMDKPVGKVEDHYAHSNGSKL